MNTGGGSYTNGAFSLGSMGLNINLQAGVNAFGAQSTAGLNQPGAGLGGIAGGGLGLGGSRSLPGAGAAGALGGAGLAGLTGAGSLGGGGGGAGALAMPPGGVPGIPASSGGMPPASSGGAGGAPTSLAGAGVSETLVLDLTNPDARENALLELSKKREQFPDLAPFLWHTPGVVAALLQEIVAIYSLLSPPSLTAHASNRVCNALALLQCVASHHDTRSLFLQAHVPLFLYPFLNTVSKTRPFEYLRLTSLGVIGALVKVDDTDVINFLLSTEIIPLCLRTMEMGSELSKTVATFIVQKILLDETGLNYICATAERFFAVGAVLQNMVNTLAEQPSVRLLKHIIRCYLRLSDNPRAREALRQCLPELLRDANFTACLKDDRITRQWLAQLLQTVNTGDGSGAPPPGAPLGQPPSE